MNRPTVEREDARYLWIDIETAGLEPRHQQLLEIGAIITDSHYQVLGTYSACVRLNGSPIDVYVREMHTDNGLLAACNQPEAAADATTAWEWLYDWIQTYDADDPRPYILAGSGIAHFDRPWMAADPAGRRILDLGPYWCMDTGMVRRFLKDCGIDASLDASSGAGKTHRALDDITAHLAEYRHARQLVMAAFLAAHETVAVDAAI